MTVSNKFSPSYHPIQWTDADRSLRFFPAHLTCRDEIPVHELLDGLEPKWLNQCITLQQAMQDISHGEDLTRLRWTVMNLESSHAGKLWPCNNQEFHTTQFCCSWLTTLNERRRMKKYPYRSVYVSNLTPSLELRLHRLTYHVASVMLLKCAIISA